MHLITSQLVTNAVDVGVNYAQLANRRSRLDGRDISFSIVVRLIAPWRTVTPLAYVCTCTSGRFARCFLVVPAGRLSIEYFQGRALKLASCAIRSAAILVARIGQ